MQTCQVLKIGISKTFYETSTGWLVAFSGTIVINKVDCNFPFSGKI